MGFPKDIGDEDCLNVSLNCGLGGSGLWDSDRCKVHISRVLQIPAKEGWISGHILYGEAFEMWQPCWAIMMFSTLKWWLQRMQPLKWDTSYDASQVHTASYCIKVSACQQEKSTINMAAAVLTGGSWGINSLKFLLSASEHSCVWHESRNLCPQEDCVVLCFVSTVYSHSAFIVCNVLQLRIQRNPKHARSYRFHFKLRYQHNAMATGLRFILSLFYKDQLHF